MADRRYGEPAPPTHTEVRHQDWEGHDLSEREDTAVAFIDVDLTDASSRGALFSECTFRECRFSSSTHVDSAFVNCTFTGCRFFDATFTDCKLVGSMFDRCSFELLRCEGGDCSFVGMPGADLRRASFRDVRMREADLTGARCDGARLHRVDLSAASLHGAKLSDADLRGSDLSSLDPTAVTLDGAIVDPDQAIVIATALGLDVQPDPPDAA
jgi:fluoroquinolone resistance protein